MPTPEPNTKGISMSDRGKQLHATADGQIAALIGLMSTVDAASLRLRAQAGRSSATGVSPVRAAHGGQLPADRSVRRTQ
jgi:hypothetical protein